MSIWLYVYGAGMTMAAGMGWYMYLDYWSKTKDISSPYLKVARSKGKKILLLVDSGAGSYVMVEAEKEALGYTTKEFGNFEAYEEGIKPFGSGIKKVPLGLAHAELEVLVTPAAAIWINKHGDQVTQEMIDSMPDSVQYLYCDHITNAEEKDDKGNITNPGTVCGWVGPLIPLELKDKPSSVKELWEKFKEKKKDIPEPKEVPKEIPLCPKCNTKLKKVMSDRTYSTIPNQVIYGLSKVRAWVDEVVSPLTMEMAIESTKLNTLKKAKNKNDELMKLVLVLGPTLFFGALAYVVIMQQGGGGGGEPGMMENMGQALKSGAGQ